MNNVIVKYGFKFSKLNVVIILRICDKLSQLVDLILNGKSNVPRNDFFIYFLLAPSIPLLMIGPKLN